MSPVLAILTAPKESVEKKPGKKILPNLQSLDAMHVLLQKERGRVVVPSDLDAEGNLV